MTYSLINPSIIQENLMNNQELIRQFLDLYQEQIPMDLQELKDAVTSEVHVEIADKAHHIKPTMEYIGARTLREKLQQLEDAGKNGAEISHIHTLFLEIEQDMTTLLQELTNYKQEV